MTRNEHPAGGIPPDPGFVGRVREIARLGAALDEVIAGRGQAWVVQGPGGIGKTRLATETSHQARARGLRCLFAQCEPVGHAPALWPWIQLLRSALEPLPNEVADALLEGGAAELAPLLRPGSTEALAVGPPEAEAAEARFRLYDAVSHFWARFAREEPTLLVVEDAHAADRASLELLDFVARAAPNRPLMLLVTHRDPGEIADEVRRAALSELGRSARRLRLSGLGDEEVGQLLETILGEPVDPAVASAVHARCEGNPLFVDEVAHLMIDEGSVDARTAESLRLPQEVGATIRRRLTHVSPEARRILGTAAVIGREFDSHLLAQLCPESQKELVSLLDSIQSAEVVDEVPGSPGHYRFAHALIHETLYQDLLLDERRRLHGEVGARLEESGSGRPEERAAAVAHHYAHSWLEGETAWKACRFAREAGRHALASFAYADAAAYFEQALQALALTPHPELELECSLALSEARRNEGLLDAARDAAHRAIELARRLRDGEGIARGAVHYASGDENGMSLDPERVAVLSEALEALPATPSLLRVQVMNRLAESLYFSDQHREAVQLTERAYAMAVQLDDANAIASCINMRRWASWTPTNARERVELCRELQGIAHELQSVSLSVEANCGLAENLLELGDLEGADAALSVFYDLTDELQRGDMLFARETFRSLRCAIAGEFDEAERYSRAALEIGQKINSQIAAEWFAVQLILIREAQGRGAEILTTLRKFATARPRAQVRAGLARVLGREGQLEEAREILDDLVASLDRLHEDVNWPFTLACLSEVAHRLDDSRAAARLLEIFRVYEGRMVILGLKLGWIGPADRYLGLLQATLGQSTEATAFLNRALAQVEALGAHHVASEIRADLKSIEAGAAPDASEPAPDRVRAPRVARLQRRGEYWLVGLGDRSDLFRHTKGFQHLAALVAEPGREFHAVDLVTGGVGRSEARDDGDAGEAIDAQARAAYGRRLADLREDLSEAERLGDPARASTIQEEIDALAREVSRAVGLGGRSRRQGSNAERARVNVTRTLALAVQKIEDASPTLGRHLRANIRTGAFCVYEPGPDDQLEWQIQL